MDKSSGYLLNHGFLYYHNHNTRHMPIKCCKKKKGVTASDFKGVVMYLAVVSAGQRARANPSWMELCSPILQMRLHLNMWSPNALTYVMVTKTTPHHSKMPPRSAAPCKVEIVGKCCRREWHEGEAPGMKGRPPLSFGGNHLTNFRTFHNMSKPW
jgi:hypothetical protein